MLEKESSLQPNPVDYSFTDDQFYLFEEDWTQRPDEYGYALIQEGIYSFSTDKGVVYDILFKPSFYIFGDEAAFSKHVYEFIIAVAFLPEYQIGPDPKIPVTIAAIFKHFFIHSDKNICIYICDSSDGKQLARQRKFAQWFQFFAEDTAYVHLDDRILDADGTIYPVALITKRQNPHLMDIIQALDGLIKTYTKTDRTN